MCADTTNQNSVLQRSHGFINPFDSIVNIYSFQDGMLCPIREKRKGFVSCSTLRAVHIQLFREWLSEKVHATIPKGIVGGFEFTILQ